MVYQMKFRAWQILWIMTLHYSQLNTRLPLLGYPDHAFCYRMIVLLRVQRQDLLAYLDLLHL